MLKHGKEGKENDPTFALGLSLSSSHLFSFYIKGYFVLEVDEEMRQSRKDEDENEEKEVGQNYTM